MSRSSGLQTVIEGLAKHPYLWTLSVCLCLTPFISGADQSFSSYALWLETLVAIGATAVFGLYIYRTGSPDQSRLYILAISVAVSVFFTIRLGVQPENTAVGNVAGVCAVCIIAVLVFLSFAILRDGKSFKQFQPQINSLMIIGLGFLLKLCYVVVTSIYTRQHDVGTFGADESEHAQYIEYLLFNQHLPDFDIRGHWQFYHPPLHHALCAAWIYLNENVFAIGYDAARESLQTLTLFYSMCIVISAYRILRYFRLEGSALYIPLIIVSFHPAFIIFSGSINNDVLSVAFIMGAVLTTLEWYKNQTMLGIMKIALCVGLGMMTKLSAALVAPPIALVFLIVLIKKARTNGKMLLLQYACFGLICVPLGLWFGIRNYVNWGIPPTYVAAMGPDSDQYLGNLSFISRTTDFSLHQFASPYVQWSSYEQGYNEYNPLISLMKSSLFGEWNVVKEDNALVGSIGVAVTSVFFWLNVFLAGIALAATIAVCFRKSSATPTEKLFLVSFYVLMLTSFYKMSFDYPFRCTMDFRYVTPTAILGAVFIGLFLKSSICKSATTNRIISNLLYIGAFSFATLCAFIYLAID